MLQCITGSACTTVSSICSSLGAEVTCRHHEGCSQAAGRGFCASLIATLWGGCSNHQESPAGLHWCLG